MDIKKNRIVGEKIKSIESMDDAIAGGIYLGSPGKDIFLMLPYLSDEQMREVADMLAYQWCESPPVTNVNYAALIRYTYGQFAKQGIHRSKEDFERMKKEKQEWELPRKFLKFLYEEFDKINNFYGLCILCEMEAHRLGDEAVLNKDGLKLVEMEDMYLKAISFAKECNSYKHMFSLYYWAAKCFIEFGSEDNAIRYSKLAIREAGKYYHKYFPKGEQYYSVRLGHCAEYIKKVKP